MAEGSRVIASKNYGYTEAQFFTDDLSIFFSLFLPFSFSYFSSQNFKIKITHSLHYSIRSKRINDWRTNSVLKMRALRKLPSRRSVHTHTKARAYPDVQLNYGKKLCPEKEFFLSSNRSGWLIHFPHYISVFVLVFLLWFYYSMILMASHAIFSHKHCTLRTTLEMGKNRQLTSAFACVLIWRKCPEENAGNGISKTLNFKVFRGSMPVQQPPR